MNLVLPHPREFFPSLPIRMDYYPSPLRPRHFIPIPVPTKTFPSYT